MAVPSLSVTDADLAPLKRIYTLCQVLPHCRITFTTRSCWNKTALKLFLPQFSGWHVSAQCWIHPLHLGLLHRGRAGFSIERHAGKVFQCSNQLCQLPLSHGCKPRSDQHFLTSRNNSGFWIQSQGYFYPKHKLLSISHQTPTWTCCEHRMNPHGDTKLLLTVPKDAYLQYTGLCLC